MKVGMSKMLVPVMTILVYVAILLDIPVFREITVFVYLSFIPGFAVLKLFKLKLSLLDVTLFSLGLSLVSLMLMGFLVNEVYVLIGLSRPLTAIPLLVSISASTLVVLFLGYLRCSTESPKLEFSFGNIPKSFLALLILMIILPIVTAVGVVYTNVTILLFSCVIIASLCIMSIGLRRLFPENCVPFLILSISISLIFLVQLLSKHIVGWDSNLEYYIFRLTQINGQWSPLNADLHSLVAQNYNAVLSINLLPSVYSSIMNVEGEIVFKILYPLLWSVGVPLVLYRIFGNQFGKSIGLLSTFFFIFTYAAFYGPEPLSQNRQIVGTFFLLLSIFLLTNNTISMTNRRVLLVIFGVALALSHYVLTYLFLALVVLVFLVSRRKPKTDKVINFYTLLILFMLSFSWYTFSSGSVLITLENTIRFTLIESLTGKYITLAAGSATDIYTIPQFFTAATWINLALLGMVYLSLVIGILATTLKPIRIGISTQFRVISIAAATILAAAVILPRFAQIIDFTRFQAITLLFLSPCIVLGAKTIITALINTLTKIKRPFILQGTFKSKNANIAFLLIAVLASAYFLSQVGFINRVTGGPVHSFTIDFDRIKVSYEGQVKMNLYGAYIAEQDVFSAEWLQSHKVATAKVYADGMFAGHVLTSYGLVPDTLLFPLTNTTIPEQFTFIYLGSLNVVNGVIAVDTGSFSNWKIFNISEISHILGESDLLYSNGASEIFSFSGVR
jgi:uncharacterized membrane protein